MEYAYIFLLAALLPFVFSSDARVPSRLNAHRAKRLIRGEESDHALTPYMVSLQGKLVTSRFLGIPMSSRNVFCGGTLVSDRWVLTAAHCFSDGAHRPSDWHARFASPNIHRSLRETFFHVLGKILNKVEWQQMEYHPQQIIIHPQYRTRGDFLNDIALVKLKETVPFSETDRVGVVKIAKASDSLVSDSCMAYGWGCSNFGSTVTASIRKASLPLLSGRRCVQIWRINSGIQICAGQSSKMQSACQGDSGGPLICKTAAGHTVQTGIISYVHGANPTRFPVVLTKVSAYADWINYNIKQ